MRLLKKYQDMDFSAIMYHPDLAHDIALIEKEMTDSQSQDDIRHFLTKLLKAIETEADSIKSELNSRSATMETIEKNTAACLAYLKPKNTKGNI